MLTKYEVYRHIPKTCSRDDFFSLLLDRLDTRPECGGGIHGVIGAARVNDAYRITITGSMLGAETVIIDRGNRRYEARWFKGDAQALSAFDVSKDGTQTLTDLYNCIAGWVDMANGTHRPRDLFEAFQVL